MKLIYNSISAWPKLTWVAKFEQGKDDITIFHGAGVEVAENWCVEAVWAGDYSDGGFDQTDLIFGSGVRCRDNAVVFVSSGSTLDRLWYYLISGINYVANSLPGLMAVANVSFLDDYLYYANDVNSIVKGLTDYKKKIPCQKGELRLVYYNNLLWDGTNFTEMAKPDTAPHFDRFETYASYLMDNAAFLKKNMWGAEPSLGVLSWNSNCQLSFR